MRHCVELAELLSAYADGQTVPAQTELIETHLASCRACRDALRRLRETALLLKCEDDWSPPDLRLRIAHAYAGKRSGSSHMSVLAVLALGISIIALSLQIGQAPRLATPLAPYATSTSTKQALTACAACSPAMQVARHGFNFPASRSPVQGSTAVNPTAQATAGRSLGSRVITSLKSTARLRGAAPIPI